MTFTQLEYIVAIDDHRSFQRAAKHCFVTQPTLSMQVQKLEDFLGVSIFDRSRSPVMPTSIGSIIIEQGRIILRERDKMKVIIDSAQNLPEGEIKVAIIPTLAPYLLPRFIQDFLSSYPDINLNIQEYTTDIQIEKLKKGELDVGVMVTPLSDPSLSEEVILYERLYLYLSDDHPLLAHKYIETHQLENHNLWLLEEGHCLRTQVINFCDLRGANYMSAHLTYASGSIDTLIRLVDKGQGSTVIPAFALEHLSSKQTKKVRPFLTPVPVRQISMVTYRPYLKKHLIDKLKESILRHVPAEMKNAKESMIVDI